MLNIIIWGTGILAKRYMDGYYNRMGDFVRIVAFVDNSEEKQKREFYGYPVISYEETNSYAFDYIVIMNTFTREIYKQIGKEVENDKVVISLNQFFELFVNSGYWKDKDILFYGDRMSYDLVEYRARFTFKSVLYYGKSEINIIKNFDFIFLCPPRLISPQERLNYEERYCEEIHRCFNIQDMNVLKFDEWIFYLQCDRKIEGGNENKDKRFFIIASSDPIQGWGNILIRVWGGIAYARNHQMIPVIDMKNLKNQYLSEKMVGKHNAWEDFFEPISEYDLDEVYNSQYVVLSGIDTHIVGAMELKSIIYKQYLITQLNQTYIKLFPSRGKVLGVVYRGTDYNRAYGHNALSDLDEYIEYIKKYMVQIAYDYIFLATEVEDATIRFKNEFGNKVFWVEQKRYAATERRWLALIHFERENDEIKKGVEYITVLDLLSKCDAIVGTDTGTVRAAIILNKKKYEYINILKI